MKDPDSIAAREAIDAITQARVRGMVSQEAVNWVYGKAYEQFRKEALATATKQLEEESKWAGK